MFQRIDGTDKVGESYCCVLAFCGHSASGGPEEPVLFWRTADLLHQGAGPLGQQPRRDHPDAEAVSAHATAGLPPVGKHVTPLFFFFFHCWKAPPHVSEALCKCHLSATYFRRKSFGSPNTNTVSLLVILCKIIVNNIHELVSTNPISCHHSDLGRSLFKYFSRSGSV